MSTESRSDQPDAGNPLRDRFIRYWPWPFGKQKTGIALSERIASGAVGRRCREAAVEEEKRLLYVSMTRARDLLVLAWPKKKTTGEWFECIDAAWMKPDDGCDSLILPDGQRIPCERKTLRLPEEACEPDDTAPRLHWYRAPETVPSRLPLIFNPSSSDEVACTVAETVAIGTRVPLRGSPAMDTLGTAIHACIAAAVADRAVAQTCEDVAAILHRHDAANWVDAGAIHGQIQAFLAWLDERWPGCEAFAEIPIESVLPHGQVMQGRIDLVLRTAEGWVLFDHKSNPGSARWDKLAREHGGQLAAYGRAVKEATAFPVMESWLFLPIAAHALCIETARHIFGE